MIYLFKSGCFENCSKIQRPQVYSKFPFKALLGFYPFWVHFKDSFARPLGPQSPPPVVLAKLYRLSTAVGMPWKEISPWKKRAQECSFFFFVRLWAFCLHPMPQTAPLPPLLLLVLILMLASAATGVYAAHLTDRLSAWTIVWSPLGPSHPPRTQSEGQ